MAIFTTWTTYGTWLPGDQRGWFEPGAGLKEPDELLMLQARLKMSADAVILTLEQRNIVEATVTAHCKIRGWELHALNCRSNHIHVLLSANTLIEQPHEQFKAWCSRKLKPTDPTRKKWWTERGWDVYVDDEESLEIVAEYIRNQ